MSSTNNALQVVIDFEESGYRYYTKIAAIATNPLTKKVFESLASQEEEHIRQAKELFEKIDAPESGTKEQPELEQTIRQFFEAFSSGQRQDWKMDNAEAYLRAIDLEKQGYQMYEKLASESRDSQLANWYRLVQKEEKTHLQALENVYAYFRDPGDWQHEDERSTWGWMNM